MLARFRADFVQENGEQECQAGQKSAGNLVTMKS